MMSSWQKCKLGEILDLITKGTTPPKGKGFVNNGINYIKSDAIGYDGQIDTSKFVQIDLETHQKFKRSQLKDGDILYSMAGIYLGKNAIVKSEMLPANTNQALAILRLNQNKATPEYISYYLSQKEIVEYVNNMSGQTAQPNINFQEISSILLLLPPLEEQKAIAEVLSSLDDKIDLLHRQNQTLEDLAQTLFRQWFIEEAKEEWEDKPLGEIALHVKNNIKTSSFKNKSFFHFSLPAFDNGQRPIKELGNEILSNKYQVVKNSILVSKLNPRTPRIWLIDGNIDEDNSICSTEFQVLYPKEEIWRGFIYCYLKTEQAIQKLAGASGGTSGSHQRVKPEDIFNLIFQYPDIETLKKFDDISSDYLKKIKVNQKQIQILEDLRDTLLPKLLNGEIRLNG